jgi:putative hemolysin
MSACQTDQNAGSIRLPPLLKGYMRTGALIGPDAVVDLAFGTTDVFLTMPVSLIDPRYISYFTTPGQLAA